jgi:hypothetical protein
MATTWPQQRPPRSVRKGVCAGRWRALGRNRTCGPRFRKPLLYPLSYEGRVQSSSGEAPGRSPGSAPLPPSCRHHSPSYRVDGVGRHLRHARHDLAVGVHGDRDGGVAKRLADDLRMHPTLTGASCAARTSASAERPRSITSSSPRPGGGIDLAKLRVVCVRCHARRTGRQGALAKRRRAATKKRRK